MAIMIPTKPYAYTERSEEDKIFQAFKSLPDDYYVFHSYKINQVIDDKLYRNEMDFLIFHPALGILCIECKNGLVTPANGEWYYSPQKAEKNIEPMKNGGPFRQSESRMNDLKGHMERHSIRLKEDNTKTLLDHCKLTYAVCFPKIEFSEMEIKIFNEIKRFKDMLPSDSPEEIIIYGSDLKNADKLEDKIKKIFSFKIPERTITTGLNGNPLHNNDITNLFERILCPNFHIVETADENGNIVYISLNEEQQHLLEVIKDKTEMAVSGFAGTGKTVLAIQVARFKAAEGEKVLFICSNHFLREELKNNYQKKNKKINFIDIDYIRDTWLEGIDLKNKKEIYECLDAIINSKRDPYRNKEKFKNKYTTVVVDEGQDFDKPVICDILHSLYGIMRDENPFLNKSDEHGIMSLRNRLENKIGRIKEEHRKNFYFFYDEFQADSDKVVPDFINSIENHVGLEKICRNTKNIAQTAFKPLIDYGLKYCQRAEEGDKVQINFYKNTSELLKLLDESLKRINDSSTVILTCKNDEDESELAKAYNKIANKNQIKYYKFSQNRQVLFASWRKFKGLERKNVIIVDFDSDRFFIEEDNNAFKSFYVSVSRAREHVYILVPILTHSKAFLYSDNIMAYNYYQSVLKNANKESLTEREREIVDFWERIESRQQVDFLELINVAYNEKETHDSTIEQINQEIRKENKIHHSLLNEAFVEQFKKGRKTNVRDAICNALNSENAYCLDILEREKRYFLLNEEKEVENMGIPAERFICDILCYGLVWGEIVLSIKGTEPTIFNLNEFCKRYKTTQEVVISEYNHVMNSDYSDRDFGKFAYGEIKLLTKELWQILQRGLHEKLIFLTKELSNEYVVDANIENENLHNLIRIEKETMNYLLALYSKAERNGLDEYEYGFWEWFYQHRSCEDLTMVNF